jgi:protocatechuate 3,4-dioxygenase beta subunit
MSRRVIVLVFATFLTLGWGILASGCGSQATTSETSASTALSSTTTSQTSADSGALTVGVTEGPYYITGTSELTNGELNYTGLPGDPIMISGYVYGGVGNSKPLAGAKIEIWQADNNGSYHPNTNGDASQFSAGELALRGYVLTDAKGYYQFTSIYPGIYPGRCRHIHVRVSASSYGGVVTQLIVPAKPGDSVTPEQDQIARSLPAVNHLTFETVDGVQTGSFDFHLGGD